MSINNLAASAVGKMKKICFSICFCLQIVFKMLEDQPRDQISCQRSFHDDQNAEKPTPLPSGSIAVVRGLPCVLAIRAAALSADLITGLTFKHLERNLTAKTTKRTSFSDLTALAAKLSIPNRTKFSNKSYTALTVDAHIG